MTMDNTQSYKGFSIFYGTIKYDEKENSFTGLIARKGCLRIESPVIYRNNYVAICREIDKYANLM